MTATDFADASPEKRLFISLLTRDISLEAAFLDLIDNSVNAAVAPFADRLQTAEDYVKVLDDATVQPQTNIRIVFSSDRISITDTAPGISLTAASKHVFRFGRSADTDSDTDRLSVYGLGLKRAFFKAGRRVKVESDHESGGFELDLDVDEWSKKNEPRWQFPISERPAASANECGTRIVITELHHETASRLDEAFEANLKTRIAATYAYFLKKFVRIFVNGERVTSTELGFSKHTARDSGSEEGVTYTVLAGLGTPEGKQYRDAGAGWFVFCNGRAVISADKTALTGWQNNGLPIFQPKHRPFLGMVHFVSRYPDHLPWDTTKSRINEDSAVWQSTKLCMGTVGRSVIAFLDSRYPTKGSDFTLAELGLDGEKPVDAIRASVGEARPFQKPPVSMTDDNIKIQYNAKWSQVLKIARYLSRPDMSGAQVGRHTFRFFLRNEVRED